MKKLIFLLVLWFAIPFAMADDIQEQASVVNSENEAVSFTDDLKIIQKTDHEENQEQHLIINVTYPQIAGENLSESVQKFNRLMSDAVNKEVSQFKKYVLADMPHMQTLPEEVRKNTFNMNYDVNVVKPGNKIIVSARLSIEGFQAGRAHPYHKHVTLNFDLTDGKPIALNDLFKPKAKYLNVIAHYSNIKLNEKIEDKLMITEGTKPLAKNFQNWNLEDDGMVITFNEYQVAAYVYGTPEVKVPYEVLKNVISPHAIIYPCVVKPSSCPLIKAKG